MAIWDDLAPPSSVPMAAPTATPTAIPTTAPTYNQPGMPFNIPVLGTILDTGRDLLVGPGNENLTTQEQVTRAILNGIVLAKAPQALGDIHANNAARDRSALSALADPQFRAKVDEYKVAGMADKDAIRAAAAIVRIPGGFALPQSIAELPPVDPAASLNYMLKSDILGEAEGIRDGAQPSVGPDVSPKAVQRARLRNLMGATQAPGGERIMGSLQTQVADLIPDPKKLRREGGRYFNPLTNEEVPPPGGGSTVPEGMGTPPVSSGMPPVGTAPVTTDTRPNTEDLIAEGAETSEITGESTTWEYDEAGLPLPSDGVSKYKLSEDWNSAKGKWNEFLVEKTPEEYATEVKVRRDELAKFYDGVEKTKADRYEERRKLTSEAEVVAFDAKVIADSLLRYAVNEDGSPNLSVWTQDQRHKVSKDGFVEAGKYIVKQGFRGSPAGQNFEFEGVADNGAIALFVGDRGVAAQMLARAITKDRVSEQDYLTFAKKLPLVTDTRVVAEEKIRNLPKAIMEIYKRSLARTEAAEEELDAARRPKLQNPDPLTRSRKQRAPAPRREAAPEAKPETRSNEIMKTVPGWE